MSERDGTAIARDVKTVVNTTAGADVVVVAGLKGSYIFHTAAAQRKQDGSLPRTAYQLQITRSRYHGAHFRLMGLFTRRKEHISRGLAMQEEADRERRRERRRRQRELAEEGLAVRLGAKTVLHPRDSHRHRRHGHRREDSGIPIMHAADVTHDHPNGHGVHIVRPGSMRHGYGRHNAIPVMRSEGGRHAYYDDGGVPIMRSEGSHPSHRNTDPVIPVARSTSRHDQRYAGSQAGHGLRRSSRHGQRHHRSH
ncbi:hypothetical protein EW145_g98 [Phellinidium pouzarii]|uniref:Uncharacterized protein n=1 Tax=Phellinidium pouzarii TaxID=167371 RepID=A0A4S4LK84_9AGAM|nr:hypothetical protein EW145_g98 [Phellinidium pouzarii]